MDRSSFLSCLPFLTPSSLNTWPPNNNVLRRKDGPSTAASSVEPMTAPLSRRYEVLLSRSNDYRLSIEATTTTPAVARESEEGKTDSSTSTPRIIYFLNSNNEDDSGRPAPPNGTSTSMPTRRPRADPTMCSIEMCLEYTEISPQSASAAFLESSLSHNISQRSNRSTTTTTPERSRRGVLEHCTNVFFRIDSRIYKVNLSSLRHIIVHPSSITNNSERKANAKGGEDAGNDPDPTTDAGLEDYLVGDGEVSVKKKKPKKPPCLLLVFPSVSLRIFALPSTISSLDNQDEDASLYELQTTRTRLGEVIFELHQHNNQDSLVFSSLDATSPSSHSNTTGSSSQQQHQRPSLKHFDDDDDDAENQSSADRNNSDPKSNTSHKQTDGSLEGGRSKSKFKRRIDAYYQCQSNLQCIQALLQAPISSFSSSTTATSVTTNESTTASEKNFSREEDPRPLLQQEVQSLLSPLLTATVDQIAACYVDPASVAHEWQQQEQQQSTSLQTNLQPLLDQFFPTPTERRKRRRRQPHSLGGQQPHFGSSSPAQYPQEQQQQNHSQKPPPPVNVETTIANVQALLQKFQRESEQRYELLLLPTRKK
ncbi:hypothetical protein ACA910_020729 [Epithemia clementina (nom. ined.)]